MKRLVSFLLILLLLCGCGPFATLPEEQDADPATVEHPSAAEIWQALARAVDHGAIPGSQRLAQYVIVLARQGELSTAEVARFDAVFTGAATSDRPLDADDAKRLREMSNVNASSMTRQSR